MLSWLVILFCSVFFALSLKRVFSGVFSTLHLGTIVFFVMQVIPLFVECIWGYDDLTFILKNMYYATQDQSVHILYCVFVVVTMVFLWSGGEYFCRKREYIVEEKKYFQANIYLFVLLLLGILSPAIALIVAPDPSIYLTFARFYKLEFNPFDTSYIYYVTVVRFVLYFSFLSIVLLYFFNDDRNKIYNFFVYLGIALVTWIEGKRSLIVFSFLAIVAIDIIRNRYANKKTFFAIKTICFALISVIFFIVYKEYTGKDVEMDFLSQYNQYYSRMACVKTAIYSVFYDQPILQYPGQSFVYDIFFFVPRGLWPDKPAMFVKYFTAYAVNRKNVDFLSWNLIINMWCEFIANIGIWGYLLGLSLVAIIAKFADFTNNILVRMWGMIFIALYFTFGFEHVVIIVFCIFLVSLISQKIKERM